jgi:hypothetical protein
MTIHRSIYANFLPHSGQNLLPEPSVVPQSGQNFGDEAAAATGLGAGGPHCGQNFAPFNAVLQFEHDSIPPALADFT